MSGLCSYFHGVGFGLFVLATATFAQDVRLRVEVVDDTGFEHAPYVLLVGKSANGVPLTVDDPSGNLAIANADQTSNNVAPSPVDMLETLKDDSGSPFTITSPFTGEERVVYTFDIQTIGSGGFYVFYNDGSGASPFTYVDNANPSPVTGNFRFDLCEFTYNPGIVSGGDLTTIDQFGFQLQMELFEIDESDPNNPNAETLLDRRTYYRSFESMLEGFEDLGFEEVFFGLGNDDEPIANWTMADGMANFVRVLGPGQVASQSGSPAPYPSFQGMLAALANRGYRFTVSGNANGSNYFYEGAIESDGSGGYQASLTNGTTFPDPPDVSGVDSEGNPFNFEVPSGTDVTLNFPATDEGSKNGDFFIYGAALNSDSFSVEGLTAEQISQDTNTVYGAIVRDVLSAINFGYLGGVWSDTSVRWYAPAPSAFPFGGARTSLPSPSMSTGEPTPNDGRYNPWAAYLYNESDAYGFAFSDRAGPSPLLTFPTDKTYTLRITLLPDERLDSPKPYVTGTTPNTISLAWDAIDDTTSYTVTGYEINVLSPSGVPAQSVDASTTTATLDGLEPGWPYEIEVRVVGQQKGDSSKTVSPPAQSVHARTESEATTGVPTTDLDTDEVSFRASFNWSPDAIARAGLTVDPSGEVESVFLTNAGYGYSRDTIPISIAGGGSGGLAQGTVSSQGGSSLGYVRSVSIENPSATYQSPPDLTLDVPEAAPGAGAELRALLVEDQISKVLIVNAGGGYALSGDQRPSLLVNGAAPTAADGLTLELANNVVAAMSVASPGTNYGGATVEFSAGGSIPATAHVIVENGSVAGAYVSNGGEGYPSDVDVTIVQGNNESATGRAIVQNGAITDILIEEAGSGYVDSPAVFFSSPAGEESDARGVASVGAGNIINGIAIVDTGAGFNSGDSPLKAEITQSIGSGADFEGVVHEGSLVSVQKNSGGSGYSIPQVIIETPAGAPGMGATAVPVVVNGSISQILLTDQGSGYSSADGERPTLRLESDFGDGSFSAIIPPAAITSAGAIQFVEIQNTGSNYLGPVVTIPPPDAYDQNQVELIDANNAAASLTYQTRGGAAGSWQSDGQTAVLRGKIDPSASDSFVDNQYALVLSHGSDNPPDEPVFADILSLPLSGSSSNDFNLGVPSLNGNEAPVGPRPAADETATGPYGSTSGTALVVTIPFNPIPLKHFYAVSLPGQQSTISFEEWAGLFALDGSLPGDDGDRDLQPNLIEYIRQTNPTRSNPNGILSTEFAPTPQGGEMVARYRLSKSVEGVADRIEWSTDFVNWSSAEVSYEADQDMGDFVERTARIPLMNGLPYLFLRLNVEATE